MYNVKVEIRSPYQIPLMQWSYVYCNKLSSKFSPEPSDFFFWQLPPNCQLLNVTVNLFGQKRKDSEDKLEVKSDLF